jgi:hypothetical protein
MKSLTTRLGATTVNRHANPADELRGLFRRGLSDVQRFILISSAAFMIRDFDLYQALPENVLQILGCAPPPHLVLIALAGYVFTVVVPLLIHMINGDKPATNHWHLLYRSSFYLFFLCSQSLNSYFMLVLGLGLFLYFLEQSLVGVLIYRLQHDRSLPV